MVKAVNNNPSVFANMCNKLPAMPAFLGGKPVVKQPEGFCTKVGRLASGIAGGFRACFTCCGRCSKKPVVQNPTLPARVKAAVANVVGSSVQAVKNNPKKTAGAVVTLAGLGAAVYTGHAGQGIEILKNQVNAGLAFLKNQTQQ